MTINPRAVIGLLSLAMIGGGIGVHSPAAAVATVGFLLWIDCAIWSAQRPTRPPG